jgi:hypothetical protein
MTNGELTTADERLLTTFMQQLRATPLDAAPRMPDARVLWLKSQLIQRWDAQRKVQLPLDVAEPFEVAAGLAAAVFLLAWSMPSAFAWIPRLLF